MGRRPHTCARSTTCSRAALQSLGSETAPGDSLAGALSRAMDGRDCLLVLDGLDLDATQAGPVLQSLLDGTADARVVVTARTTAGEPHEAVVRVGPLPVPPHRSPLEGPAVELFLRRIRSAGGQQVDLDTQAHEVRRLLDATGGLPLLIEQVAVQSALVGLSNAMSTVSLDQAVDSAHALLDDASATALRRIGVLDFPVGLGVLARVLDLPVPGDGRARGQPRAPQPARGRQPRGLRHALPHPRPGARPGERRRRRRRRRPACWPGRRTTRRPTTTTAPRTPSGSATCRRCATRS